MNYELEIVYFYYLDTISEYLFIVYHIFPLTTNKNRANILASTRWGIFFS